MISEKRSLINKNDALSNGRSGLINTDNTMKKKNTLSSKDWLMEQGTLLGVLERKLTKRK